MLTQTQTQRMQTHTPLSIMFTGRLWEAVWVWLESFQEVRVLAAKDNDNASQTHLTLCCFSLTAA